MKIVAFTIVSLALTAQAPYGAAWAQGADRTDGLRSPRWTVFSDRFGTRVDYPENIFSVDAGPPVRGDGRRLLSADSRAELMIYVEENQEGHTPASFLRTFLKTSRGELDYDRVTNRFFAVSGIKDEGIFYSRCNFPQGVAGPMHCIYLSYPREEERLWDGIVTRISLSLRPSG